MAKTMGKIKLSYFNVRGRCDFIRMLVHSGNVEFEDKRITEEEWAELKPNTPFGTVPCLDVDGIQIGQSLACGRYAAKVAGLYGSDDLLVHAQIDQVVEIMTDIREQILPGAFEKDAEKKATLMKEGTEYAKTKLKCLSKILNKKNYFVGDTLTWADIHFFYVIELFNDVEKLWLLDDDELNNLKDLYERVKEDKKLKEFVENRPKTDF